MLFWQVPNVTDIGLKSSHIRKVAIIGGGLMGSGIATAFILNGVSVILKEIDSTLLQRGVKTITGINLQISFALPAFLHNWIAVDI